MIDFLLLLVIATLATWAISDVYFTGYIFLPLRRIGDRLVDSKNWFLHRLGYLMTCEYCLGHWIAAAVILGLGVFSFKWFNWFVLVLTFLIVARLSYFLKDWMSRSLGHIPQNLFDGDGNFKSDVIKREAESDEHSPPQGDNNGESEPSASACADVEDQQGDKG